MAWDDEAREEMEERSRIPPRRLTAREQAEAELEWQEASKNWRVQVEAEKAKIRAWRKLPWWRRLFSKP